MHVAQALAYITIVTRLFPIVAQALIVARLFPISAQALIVARLFLISARAYSGRVTLQSLAGRCHLHGTILEDARRAQLKYI